ncbi:serine hydrolase [Streptomyces sp. 8N616]|uniref:serine hydrolase n=1 Tax=Streptomyces sp. 8N616 TaxID=3457414 RepID=UPI003FD08209
MDEDIPERLGPRMPYRAIGTAVAAALLMGGGVAAAAYGSTHARPDGGTEAAAAASARPSASATASAGGPAERAAPEETARPARETIDTAERYKTHKVPKPVDLTAALAPVVAATNGDLSVAVLDTASGEQAVYGDGGSFDTASIVKVDILAALLLRAQDAGRQLTAQEKSYATAMIESSDNASATALWAAIGRADGLGAANERLGLAETRGGYGDHWGLTQTTAADQLKLLEAVFGEDSPLGAASRAYVQGLMGSIVPGQDWGVSAAAAGDGADTALKNGWLPRSATGLWDINSIGRVASGGRSFLVAVLSNGSRTQAAGIGTVEDAARAAVDAFTDGGA